MPKPRQWMMSAFIIMKFYMNNNNNNNNITKMLIESAAYPRDIGISRPGLFWWVKSLLTLKTNRTLLA